ncbi:MAG: hypothetical protein ACRBB6_15020 [Neptuniibacter sp.]
MKFRSDQERKWAKYFDLIGVEYIHNPEHIQLDADFFYSPSFFVKNISLFHEVDLEPTPYGFYFDVITEEDSGQFWVAQKFTQPIVFANELPADPEEDTYSLSRDQLIDGRYTIVTWFDKLYLADHQYHLMKMERDNPITGKEEKERVEIPFGAALKANI